MYTETEIANAQAIAIKYVSLCFKMLADGGSHTKRFMKCTFLLRSIVEDEFKACIQGRSSDLKSLNDMDVIKFIGELYEDFIEPMFMDHCIPKNTSPLPKVDLSNIKKVRQAKTTKRVTFLV
jgi:hypothetical protein